MCYLAPLTFNFRLIEQNRFISFSYVCSYEVVFCACASTSYVFFFSFRWALLFDFVIINAVYFVGSKLFLKFSAKYWEGLNVGTNRSGIIRVVSFLM